MGSEIWRVQSEKIGSLEPFRSERDMESFLINNPAIVGCWDPDISSSIPAMIREQVSTLTENLGKGRMDLVGIARNESNDGYELRIFELKAVEVSDKAVDQLNDYLKGWNTKNSAKKSIEKWILNLQLAEVTPSNVEEIVNSPVGVLVGPKFSPDASAKAKALKIRGVRLARFRAASSSEYYVIVEDEVGEIVESSRRNWSWKNLISMGLMDEDDYFVIRHGEIMLRVKPDISALDWYKKKVVFDEDSKRLLMSRESEIREKANSNDKKWLEKALTSLKSGKGIFLSNSTGLVYLAFGGPTASYWVPNWWWIHEKSERRLDELVTFCIKGK